MLTAIVILGIVVVVVGYIVHRWIVARRSKWAQIIDAERERHRIPLPPHSLPGEDTAKSNVYFTTATMAEMKDYVHRSLPDAGWEFGDISRQPPGISLVFRRGDKRLHILLENDLDILRGRCRERLTFAIAVNVKPSLLDQELAAIRMLGKGGNRDAVEPLIALLSDSRAAIRREVLSALTVIRDERCIPALIKRLSDEDTRVRQLAASALGEYDSQQAVEPLMAALNGNDCDLQTACAWSLGRIKDNRAVTALIAALDNPYWKLKAHAAIALGEIGDRLAVEPLLACLKNTENDSKVRGMAFLSLRKILSPGEFSTMLEQMRQEIPVHSDQHSREDHWKDAVAENVAESVTESIFDLLGLDH
jgi:hypothetical protein